VDLQVQRIMRRSGRATVPLKPVLEVNPKHKLIAGLSAKLEDTTLIADAAATLLDLALVQEGDVPTDPTGFARRVTTMLASSLG
jgi:molecular chaperone HtpG